MTEKWTERRMLNLLEDRYGMIYGNGRRWVTAEHVKDTSGHNTRRIADLIALDVWPSKGHEIHGHEVKVSRSDWLAELRDPEKSAAFRRWCDRWWLVVPDASIVKPGELPPGWGLMVAVPKQVWRSSPEGGGMVDGPGWKIRVRKPGPKLTPEPIPLSFMASLMRAAAKTAETRGRSALEAGMLL